MLLPMMLRELSGALATMADGPHDERRNSLELLNNILEVLSRDNVVRQPLTRRTHTLGSSDRLSVVRSPLPVTHTLRGYSDR